MVSGGLKMRDFTDKTIIITGATSGIGRALATNLSEMNARLILISRSEKKLNQLYDQLTSKSANPVYVYAADLTNSHACKAVFEKIINDHHKIDAVINNAGIGVFEYAHLTQTEDMLHMFQLNLFSIVESIKILLPFFKKQSFGHIINIASIAGKMATPKASIYSASKSALIAYTNALRLESETDRLFISTVNLGPVKTNFFKRADPSGSYQKQVARYMLTPDDVANKIIKVLFKRKREINLPWWMAFGTKIHYLFPTLIERLFRSQFSKK